MSTPKNNAEDKDFEKMYVDEVGQRWIIERELEDVKKQLEQAKKEKEVATKKLENQIEKITNLFEQIAHVEKTLNEEGYPVNLRLSSYVLGDNFASRLRDAFMAVRFAERQKVADKAEALRVEDELSRMF